MAWQFDLEAFKAFVAGKPAGETYDQGHAGMCALAQFGFPWAGRGNLEYQGIPFAVYEAAVYEASCDNSFGALSQRLSSLSEKRG